MALMSLVLVARNPRHHPSPRLRNPRDRPPLPLRYNRM